MAIINGTVSNDELITVESNDELLGLEGNDLLDAVGGKGNNILRGGAGNDELFGYNQDQLFGDEGDDDLYSDGKGSNLLDGGEGDDEVFPDLNDTVNGGGGDDVIFAGRGGNTFTGGSDRDVFWIANVEAPENPNIITDFNFIEETIRVDLPGVESFDDLSITQQENDAIISAGGRQLGIVEGVAPNQLNETNVVTDNDAPNNSRVNQSPSFNDATFSIAENSLEGTSIGTLSADDEDEDDILTYAITAGNLDVDGDGNNAFIIDENSGNLLVNDSDDLDFETNPQFELSVSVTDYSGDSDTANITINLEDEFDESPSVEDAAFSVLENSAEGTLVGAVEATDSDKDDVLTYSIDEDSNLDVDGDGSRAFSINANGEVIVNDRDDLDFETNPNFNLSVTVNDSNNLSDTANITINLQDEPLPQFDIEQSKQGIFSLIGDTQEIANILFNLVSNNADDVNEIGVFLVDENNAVNGKTPDSADYIKEALTQSQIVFSAISNQPNGYAELDKTRILEGYQSGERLVFYLIKNSTTDNVLSGQTSPDNVILGSTFASDAFAQVKITDTSDTIFELSWEDQIGGGDEDFDDLVMNLEIIDESAPDGSNLSNNSELLDLRDFAGETVDITAQVFREADFDNEVVFYRVDSTDGLIGDVNPENNSDYLNAALNSLVTDNITGDVVKLEAENQGTESFTAEVAGGSIFGMMIIVDGNLEDLQDTDSSNDPTVYFPYIGANSDGADHIRLLGDNTFGFEDLTDGGDMDYNDIIVKVDFTV